MWGSLLTGLLALVIVAVWLLNRPPAINEADIWTGRVSQGELLAEVTATGQLVAPEIRAVTNRSDGVVEQVLLLPGAEADTDTVLIEMSSPELLDDLARSRWALEASRADAARERVETANEFLQLEATVANAESEYLGERMELEALEELEAEQVVSQLEVHRTRLRVEALHRRLQAEQSRLNRFDELQTAREEATAAQLSERRAEVAQLEERVHSLSVAAGFAGVVQEINVEEGQRLTAGEAVARIVNPEMLIARLRVPERRAGELMLEMPVRIAVGGHTLEGRIHRIDPTVRERRVEVDVTLPNERPGNLRPDLTVNARVEVARLEDTLYMPRPPWADPDSSAVVFVVSGSEAHRREVRFGQASNTEIEVLEGLVPGEQVVLPDMSRWQDHARLRIN
ncbi:efflux RND transporter periplasmic adaptor subunit [Natronospira bacteriovora]|uniref:Efflux RND transporter periplasmic adaptor subunit n=1 Tax=Natronospira bacteriovora TaxID=3069753 RepID=A0ABU0W755_9GAMM|nr:efflux RND transporter periplasmic adaptor subunit [Natronospira sp. AB-CW4]MDQ2069764.1 efflux RND transporter periplasmic adaptor subunit [Natronospira sp. AB-CW4]